jgi:hypothetical protein
MVGASEAAWSLIAPLHLRVTGRKRKRGMVDTTTSWIDSVQQRAHPLNGGMPEGMTLAGRSTPAPTSIAECP